jgi:hypothetical protein
MLGVLPFIEERRSMKNVIKNEETLRTNCTVRFKNKHLQNHKCTLIRCTNGDCVTVKNKNHSFINILPRNYKYGLCEKGGYNFNALCSNRPVANIGLPMQNDGFSTYVLR